MKPNLLAILAIFILLPACKSVSPKKTGGNPSRLAGTWQLTYIRGADNTFEQLFPGRSPQVIFNIATSQVSGNTGCNSFAGPVSLNGGQLSFDKPLITTKMFCPGGGENAFLEALKKVDSWAVKDKTTLELKAGDEIILRLTKVQ